MSIQHNADQHGDIYSHGPRCERCGHDLETGAVPCCDDEKRSDDMTFTIEVRGPSGWDEVLHASGHAMTWERLGDAERYVEELRRETGERCAMRIIATPSYALTEGGD